MDTEEAVKIIYANWPSENYTMLKEALEYLINDNERLCKQIRHDTASNFLESKAPYDCPQGIKCPYLDKIRSALIDERANYFDTIERNPDCSAWTLDECDPETQTRLRCQATCALAWEEPLVYVELEEARKQVEILKKTLIEQVAKYIVLNSECHYRTPIKGSMLTKCDKGVFCDWTTCPIKDEKRQEAREELKEEVCGVDWDEYK